MADDVDVRDAHGNTRKISAKEISGSPGKVVQRQLVQTTVAGVPTDVSAAAPLPVAGEVSIDGTVPVSGPLTDDQLRDAPLDVAVVGTAAVTHSGATAPLTNAQLRAAALVVDTELPSALGPGGGAVATAVPMLGVIEDTSANLLRRATATKPDGAGQGPGNVPASGMHLLDTAAVASRPARTANTFADGDSGTAFGGAASMIYNGAGFERERAPYEETLLARAIRTGTAGSNPAATYTSPITTNRGFVGAIICLRAWSVPENAGALANLTLKVTAVSPNGQVTILGQVTDKYIAVAGNFYYVIRPGAAATSTGAGALPTATAIPSEQPIVAVPMPMPRRYVVQVWHRGTANDGPWDYSLDVLYTR